MKNLSLQAKLYSGAVLITGALLAVWQLAHLDGQRVALLVVACVLASLYQAMRTEGAKPTSSYSLSWIVYGVTFLLLGTPETVLVILVAHAVEWFWYRYTWHIQSFNTAAFVITATIAGLVYELAMADQWLSSFVSILLVFYANFVFTAVIHLLIGIRIKLTRGHSLSEPGIFSPSAFMTDLGMLSLGTIVVVISTVNPITAIFVIVVAYLLHGVPQIPALKRQNQREPKTGLYNLVHFNAVLKREVNQSNRLGRPLSIVMADLDKLREINNAHGHLAGDAVIKKIAQILQASVREDDTVARFGGEEFAILMPGILPDQAVIHVEAMRKAIEAAEFSIQPTSEPIKATMSFGVAGGNGNEKEALELLHNADLAVYSAKRAGRNCTRIHSANDASPIFGEVDGAPVPTQTIKRVDPEVFEIRSVETDPVVSHAALPDGFPEQNQEASSQDQDGARDKNGASPRPVREKHVRIYVAAVASSALMLAALLTGPYLERDLTGLLLFILIAAAAEVMATDVFSRDTSISASVAPLVAATMVYGPVGAVAVVLAITAITQIKDRTSIMHMVFNTSNLIIGALLGAGIVMLSGQPFLTWPPHIQIVLTLLATLALYLTTTPLVSGAVSLSTGQRTGDIWRERFRWLAPHYFGLGFLAYALVFGYIAMGAVGVLVLLVPLLMLHYGERQYIAATDPILAKLRKTNEELNKQSEAVRHLNDELFLALAATIDIRDPDVMEHSINVARYAALTAEELGMPPKKVDLVYRAGLMHDIGKLGIPEAILFKPARLTAEEHEIVMEHTVIGYDLLREFKTLHNIAEYVRFHHERYDGRGYPEGLAGEKIPWEARILALADAVEAMASDRPYRRGLPAPAILKEIQKHSGTQFDPYVVEAFNRVIQKQGDGVIVNSARFNFDDEEIQEELAGLLPTAPSRVF